MGGSPHGRDGHKGGEGGARDVKVGWGAVHAWSCVGPWWWDVLGWPEGTGMGHGASPGGLCAVGVDGVGAHHGSVSVVS